VLVEAATRAVWPPCAACKKFVDEQNVQPMGGK